MLLIKECDKVRDVALARLGIRLEDTGMATPSTWMKDDPEVLLKSIEDKKLAKEKALKEKEEKKALEDKKNNTHPKDYFSTFETQLYSQFDENGVPTHNAKGEALSKEQINGLKKKMTAMVKKWDKKQKTSEEKKTEEKTE